jgi:glutamate dehydrogenase (NAD(P)+)
MAAMEYEKRTEKEAFEAISSKIRKNTHLMLEDAKREKILPRIAAEKLAREKVLEAMRYREY